MFKPYYTATMQPVKTGDVVHFGKRAWTVESTQQSDRYLETGLWVRSMDESHFMVRISGSQVGVQFFQTKDEDDNYRVSVSDGKVHILSLCSGDAMTCDKAHYRKEIDNGMSVTEYFRQYF